MNQKDEKQKTGPIVSDAAVKENIPAKPAGELSDAELAGVAGGTAINTSRSNIKHPD